MLGNLNAGAGTAGDLNVKGNFTNNGTFNNNSRAVFFNGSSSQTISGSGLNTSSGTSNNFSYLFINNPSASVSLNNNVSVANLLNISSGATLNDGGYTLSISGTSLINNGMHTSGTNGEIMLTGAAPTISGTGTFQNLEINLLSNSNIVTISSSFNVSGNLKVTQGTVEPSGTGRTISMSGSTQSITVTNTNGFIYGSDSFGNDLSLTINSGSNTTYTGTTTTTTDDGNKFLNITVNGNLILNSGILCKFGTFTVNGNLQINSGGYIQSNNTTNGASASSNVAASFSSGNLIYNNGGSYTATDFEWPVSSSPANVSIQGSSNVTLNDSKTISGTLTISLSSDYLSLNSHILTLNGTVTGSGSISSTPASSLVIGGTVGTVNFTSGSNTIQNLTLNSGSSLTLGNQLNITGGSTPGVVTVGSTATLTTGGYLVVKSDLNGTGRIDQVLGTLSGNVTIERYITAKAGRRYSFVGSSIAQPIHTSWQQQIYITGPGTGGAVCGTTTGNGVLLTDRYNANGFDVTATNTPSMLNYTATTTNGRHYVSIANTISTNLSPGTGYVINIRGDRNSSTSGINCFTQLNSPTPAAPEAVTLSVNGTVTTGDLSVGLNDFAIHPFTLLANPYPSQISFTSFQLDNSIINNKMWTFSPYGTGNFTTYASGVIANGASGYDNTNGDYIASGQAFFVEANTIGSVNFHESHKTSGVIPNTQYFGLSGEKLIRIGFYNSSNSRLDEIVVRYNKFGTKSYNDAWDATSFSSLGQSLVSLKDSSRLAIAAHPDGNISDTTQLSVGIEAGTYSFVFSQLESLDTPQTVTLLDRFLGTSVDIRNNPTYNFNVTSDTASKGSSRFEFIVNGGTTLPVNFTGISAIQVTNGVSVKWQVANEAKIVSYSIERSTDGIHFTALLNAKATGANNYTAQDANIPTDATKLYYRIKSIGLDGAYKYSTVVTLITSNSLLITSLSIYPNPVQNKLNITLKGVVTGGLYKVKVTTLTGIIAFSKSDVPFSGNVATIDMNQLAAGMYLIELTDTKGNKLIDKFVKE